MNTKDLLDSILRGEHDDNLDAIVGTVKDRRTALQTSTFRLIQVGATGTFGNTTRPAALRGAPFVVVQKNQKRVVVKLDPNYLITHPNLRKWSGEFTSPVSILDFN